MMPMGGLRMGELLIILVVVLILFGAARLPQLGSSLGQAIRNFKRGFDTTEPPAEDKEQGTLAGGTPATNTRPENSKAPSKTG
jgi:sec-independent protein translocase protein TatA